MKALAVLLVMLSLPALAAPVDPVINVQGVARSAGGALLDGSYPMKLRLYATKTGTTPIHSQTYDTVQVTDGVFDVALGPLPDGLLEGTPLVWLEAEVGGQVLPRTEVRTVAYALVSEHANAAGVAGDLQCTTCVEEGEVAFPWALGSGKGGAAVGLECTDKCVSGGEIADGAIGPGHLQSGSVGDAALAVNYAGADSQGGPATKLACAGCVTGTKIQPNVELQGNVSTTGSLSACTDDATGCAVKVSDAGLYDHNDGWLNVQASQGIRIRAADNSGWRGVQFGGGTSYGDLSVDAGNLAVSGNAAIGVAQADERLHVAGKVKVAGAGSGVQLHDGLAAAPSNAAQAVVYRTNATGSGHPFDRAGNLVLQAQTTSGQGREVVLATGSGAPAPRVVVKETGRVGIGTTSPASALSVAGGVQVGNDTEACTPAKEGTLRWTGAELEICDGTEYTKLSYDQPVKLPTTRHWTVQSNGANWTIPYPGGTWGTAPGLSATITLTEEQLVHIRWVGTMRWAGGGNGLCHVGYTFEIDGARVGENTWGLALVVQEGATRWHTPYDVEYGVVLGPGSHTIKAMATNHGNGYGNCTLDGDGGQDYDKSRLLVSAYDPATAWYAQSSGTLGHGPGSAWETVPGLSQVFTLSSPSLVQLSVQGSQNHNSGATAHCAYRYVIDGQPQGHPDHGQALVVGDNDQGWWALALVKMGVNLSGGAHTVAFQMRNSGGGGNCYAGQSNTDYSRYRMLVRAAPQGGVSAVVSSSGTAFSVPNGWTDVPGLSYTMNLPSAGHVQAEVAGTQHNSGGNTHCGYRFVVDGVALGNPSHGQALHVGESVETWWDSTAIAWGQDFQPGIHTIKLQASNTQATAQIDGSSAPYGAYRMLIRGID